MHTITDNGINIDDWKAPIYRIFPEKRLLELLKKQQNGLVITGKWDDPFENFFLRCSGVTSAGEEVSFRRLHDSWFGQCWTLTPESDAMWRIYSCKKDGIRVSTTVEKLFDSFYDSSDELASLKYAIAQVRYMTREEIEQFLASTSFLDLTLGGNIRGLAKTLCIKRMEFSHEAEVRLLFHDAENQYTGRDFVLFPTDTSSVIDDILLVVCVTRFEHYAGSCGRA